MRISQVCAATTAALPQEVRVSTIARSFSPVLFGLSQGRAAQNNYRLEMSG